MQSKSLFASKTFWLNAVSTAATLGTVFGLDLNMTPEEQASVAAGAVVVVNALNILVRLLTRSAVHIKPKE